MSEIVLAPDALPQPGILGVEGRHRWNDAVTLNDRSIHPSDGPRAFVGSIPGLHSLADPEDLRDLATGRRGEIARRSVRRGKTITYNGFVQATSLNDLRALWTQIAGAFELMAEGEMLVTPDPDYPGVTRRFRARCLTCDDGDLDVDPNRGWSYQMPFVIGLRLGDARFYDPVLVEGDSPLAGGAVTVHNQGTAPVEPLITVHGGLPSAGIVLTNNTTGKALNFGNVSAIAAGHTLEIDFASRRITKDGSTDYRPKLQGLTSDWWDEFEEGLVPGDNEIELEGVSALGPGAYAHIAFNPAFYA